MSLFWPSHLHFGPWTSLQLHPLW